MSSIFTSPGTSTGSSPRIEYLDGIRGWASLMVLMHHLIFCCLMLSTSELLIAWELHRLYIDVENRQWLQVIIDVVIRFMTDGRLAVMLFFVVSGYALSTNHIKNGNKNLTLAAASRYFRLAIPIFCVSFIAYIMLRANMYFHVEAAALEPRQQPWLGSFYDYAPSLQHVIRFSFYDTFFNYNQQSTYLAPLWLMPKEIVGSFFIYAYLGIFRTGDTPHWKIILPLGIVLFFINPILSCFVVGYALAELKKIVDEKRPAFFESKALDIALMAAVVITAVVSIFFRPHDQLVCIYAFIIVTSVTFSPTLRNLFSCGISRFMGVISFPLFLIHIPIICSWTAYLLIKLPEMGFDPLSMAAINIVTTTALCILASMALVPMERFSIKFSKQIGRLFLSRKSFGDSKHVVPGFFLLQRGAQQISRVIQRKG